MSTALIVTPPLQPSVLTCGATNGYWTCVMAQHSGDSHYFRHLV